MGKPYLDVFLQGLREHGDEDGKSIDIVYRRASGDTSRLGLPAVQGRKRNSGE
jgi:hypothetical protein